MSDRRKFQVYHTEHFHPVYKHHLALSALTTAHAALTAPTEIPRSLRTNTRTGSVTLNWPTRSFRLPPTADCPASLRPALPARLAQWQLPSRHTPLARSAKTLCSLHPPCSPTRACTCTCSRSYSYPALILEPHYQFLFLFLIYKLIRCSVCEFLTAGRLRSRLTA